MNSCGNLHSLDAPMFQNTLDEFTSFGNSVKAAELSASESSLLQKLDVGRKLAGGTTDVSVWGHGAEAGMDIDTCVALAESSVFF